MKYSLVTRNLYFFWCVFDFHTLQWVDECRKYNLVCTKKHEHEFRVSSPEYMLINIPPPEFVLCPNAETKMRTLFEARPVPNDVSMSQANILVKVDWQRNRVLRYTRWDNPRVFINMKVLGQTIFRNIYYFCTKNPNFKKQTRQLTYILLLCLYNSYIMCLNEVWSMSCFLF